MARIFIRAKIAKERSTDKTTFEYPATWDSTKIHVVAYENNSDAMGTVEEYCLGVVTPETWEQLKNDPDIERVTPAEANEDGKKWKPQTVRVIDQEKAIMALATSETDRTRVEKNILDPEHEEIGINNTPEFDIRRFVAPGQISEDLTEKELTEE